MVTGATAKQSEELSNEEIEIRAELQQLKDRIYSRHEDDGKIERVQESSLKTYGV